MRVVSPLNNHRIIWALGVLILLGVITAAPLIKLIEPARAAVLKSSGAGVVSVNAASYLSPLAPGSIAAAFGTGLAGRTELAQALPLPTTLAGVTVTLIDSRNAQYLAPLFFVSAGQINYLIPDQIAVGATQVIVANNGVTVSQGAMQLVVSSPAIFTTTYDGRGVPVALTTYDGASYERVANPDGSARPVDQGNFWRPNYLLLFGTGLRNATNLRVRIGNTEITPLYVGAQGTFAGLDQINLMLPPNTPAGMANVTLTSDGMTSNLTQLRFMGETVPSQNSLTAADVQRVISQAVGKAQQVGLPVTIAVLDKEANVLGIFKMTGARNDVRLGSTNLQNGRVKPKPDPVPTDGLEQVTAPLRKADGSLFVPANDIRADGAALAAISKAGTSAFFSTQGNAFSPRTAGFIIQEHFPPKIDYVAGGPLFGVQFSQLLCSDIKSPGLPFGLAGDPGAVPLYKNGVAAGAVAVEGDGLYSVDLDPDDNDQSLEEIIALSASLGFEPIPEIRGDQILVDGMRLPYLNAQQSGGPAPAFNTLSGSVISPVISAPASAFTPLTLGGVVGRVVTPKFFPFKASAIPGPNSLTVADVTRIITQAGQQANRTRAAIRRPIGTPAEVNITVVDTTGAVLGIFSTQDAPIFGFDVSAQKARTAAFFSKATAGAELRAAEGGRFAKFVDAAAADGVKLDGAFAFSNRAQGFLSRPFFPDGINNTVNGPFSKPIDIWSPFNDGLQLALVRTALVNLLTGVGPFPPTPGSCTAIPSLPHGIQIFAGSVPLYRNGVLIGAVGISGDGIDQDDIIAAAGSVGFEAPANIRADQLLPRGVRLPYVKFPRHPDIP